MTASTAPTQPPDKLPPADGLDIDDWMVLAQHYQGELLKSEAAAIALRQKLADEKTANECLQDELTVLCAELTAARARLAELQARDNASAMIRVVDAVLHLQECNNLRGPDPYCENCDGEGGAMLGGGCGDCWASDIYEAENNLSVAVAALPKDWRRIETQIVVADL